MVEGKTYVMQDYIHTVGPEREREIERDTDRETEAARHRDRDLQRLHLFLQI